MGSSVLGANAGFAFSSWSQVAVKGGQVFSVHISGGDTNYADSQLRNSMLWAKRVILQADPAGGAIRYRYDGNAPSGAAGMILTGGDSAVLEGWDNIRRFQFASNQVTPGTLLITAERENP
jgi:hypothetical protein